MLSFINLHLINAIMALIVKIVTYLQFYKSLIFKQNIIAIFDYFPAYKILLVSNIAPFHYH